MHHGRQVRTDVLVRGVRLEEAVNVFLDVVLTALEDVAEVPVYFVDGVTLEDPPAVVDEGGWVEVGGWGQRGCGGGKCGWSGAVCLFVCVAALCDVHCCLLLAAC